MCDNLVVHPDSVRSSRMIFAKNSDRPVYESQPLVYQPRKRYEPGAVLKLANVEIPQVEETFLHIGSAPYWCWGYEEGMNEFGVAIGNEAIFTKDLKESAQDPFKQKGIIGMELVRLGLERGRTAREALSVITGLIEEYGQWGPASVSEGKAYNNSFIIVDPYEAWVLETVDREWAAKKVTSGFYAISNEMSIRKDWDRNSIGFKAMAIRAGWAKREDDFDAAHAYTDFTNSLQVSHIRVQRAKQLLKERAGDIDIDWVKRILRDHLEDSFLEGPFFNAALPDFQTICMHSSPANFTWGNTASSMICEMPKDEYYIPLMWWAPVTPCTSIYLPVFICEQDFPEMMSKAGTVTEKTMDPGKSPLDSYADDSYWWLFQDLLDEIKGDETGSQFNRNSKIVRKVFDRLEKKWMDKIYEIEEEAANLNRAGRREEAVELVTSFSEKCLRETLAAFSEIRKEMRGAVLV